jgi:4-hydroxy-2-oxoheptanedioate aldolase
LQQQHSTADSNPDLVFIGPNDLAQSILGYVPARGDEPEFIAALDKIVAAAKKHGKWVSRLSNSGALAKEHLEVYDTVAMGADMKAITMWFTQELDVLRK